MKKVRNILILLLAVLMLTVFVGCDDGSLDGLPSEDDNSTTPEQVYTRLEPGDLIISKFYLGNGTDKMFVISNVGSSEIDLADYQIGMRKPGTDSKYTSLQALPKVKLAAGKSLYVVNDYEGSVDVLLGKFPNLRTLPQVAKDAVGVIAEDSFTTAISCFYNDKTTVEIVTNVGDVIGKSGRHDIYGSWDIVDTVLPEDKIPRKPSALVRDYEAATHTDNGWTSVIDNLDKLSPAKGSFDPGEDVAEDQKVSAKEALKFVKAYRCGDDKVYVIQNVSKDKYVDLSTVNIVWKHATDTEDVRKATLPSLSLAPGKSVYIGNFAAESKLQRILALPHVHVAANVINEDVRIDLAKSVANATGSWGIALAEDIIDTGNKNSGGYPILTCDNPIDILEIADQYAFVKDESGNWKKLVQGTEDVKVTLASREILDQIEPPVKVE